MRGRPFAVGDVGTILRRQTRMGSPTTQHLTSVAGFSASEVYAVGHAGAVIHFDGTSWSLEASGTNNALWYSRHGSDGFVAWWSWMRPASGGAADGPDGGVVEVEDLGLPAQARPLLDCFLQAGDRRGRDRARFEEAVVGVGQPRLDQRCEQVLPARLLLGMSGAEGLVAETERDNLQ